MNHKEDKGGSMSMLPLDESEMRVSPHGDMMYRVEFHGPGDGPTDAITVEVHPDRITGIFSSSHLREDLRNPSPETRSRIIEAIRRPG